MATLKRFPVLALPALAPAMVWLQPYRPMVVVGPSMAPTYANGSVLLTQPIDRPLRRGDVVVVDTPEGPLVKRIALLPGDRRYQWHNGAQWNDLAGLALPGKKRHHRNLRCVPVPAGTVYVLGDNFQVSTDSRAFGPVDVERVTRLVVDQRDPEAFSWSDRARVDAWLALAQSRRARRT